MGGDMSIFGAVIWQARSTVWIALGGIVPSVHRAVGVEAVWNVHILHFGGSSKKTLITFKVVCFVKIDV